MCVIEKIKKILKNMKSHQYPSHPPYHLDNILEDEFNLSREDARNIRERLLATDEDNVEFLLEMYKAAYQKAKTHQKNKHKRL